MLLLATACNSTNDTVANESNQPQGQDDGNDHDDDEMDMAHVDPPEEFASLTNPFDDDREAIEAGDGLFQTYCAACHGPEGNGDGPAAEALDPQPASLSDGMMMDDLSDGYLFWRVTVGGQMDPFNSAMPAWELALTEAQRWQVISFVRTLSDGSMHMDDANGEDGEHMEDGSPMGDNE